MEIPTTTFSALRFSLADLSTPMTACLLSHTAEHKRVLAPGCMYGRATVCVVSYGPVAWLRSSAYALRLKHVVGVLPPPWLQQRC